ncbi:MAG: hypothetical protein V3S08_03430 [Phycisphaerales bacterium]
MLACLALGQGSPVVAQSGDPVVVGDDYKLEWIGIGDIRLSLDVYGRYQSDRVDAGAGAETKDSEVLFREELQLVTDVYIGHPNLLNIDVDLRLRLQQEKLDSGSAGIIQRTNETTLNYDVAGTFLRRGPAPLTLYAKNNDTVVTRLFGGSLDAELSEFGARLTVVSDILPTRLQIYHREQGQFDRLGGTDFQQKQDTFTGNGQFRPADDHLLNWVYTLDMVEQSGTLFQPNTFNRHDLQSDYTFNFGLQKRSFARTKIQFRKETGLAAFERIRFDETLRLQHTLDLDSRYEYSFDQVTTSQTQTLSRATAQVRHELFDSLISRAEIGASSLSIREADFDSDQIFGGASLNYTKQVPYGQFQATAGLVLNHRRDSDRGTTIQIIDAPHVFGIDGLIVLNRQNIIAGSIRITDVTGTIIYTDGIDYTVTTFPDRTEIRLIFGGNIGPLDVVLLDYQIGPEPASKTDTRTINVNLRYDFEEGWMRGLGVYGRYLNQDQDRQSDSPFSPLPADIRQLTIGADYNIWHLRFTAEQQWHRSTLSPFDRTRLEARWVERFGRGNSLIIGGNYNRIDRIDENSVSETFSFSGRWNHQLTEQLNLGLIVLWRDESDTTGFDSQGFDSRLEFQWKKGQTTIYGTLRGAFVDSNVNDTTNQSVLLGIRREF